MLQSPFTPAGLPISPAVSRQAVAWMVALQADEVPRGVQDDFQDWLNAHADHRRAWEHLQAATQQLHGLPPAAVHGVLEVRESKPGRRQALKRLIAVSAGGAICATAVYRHQSGDVRYATGTGERQEITLADGTRILLNTRSTVFARYEERQPIISHTAGEILVSAAPASALHLPLRLDTPQGTVSPPGARFAVRLYDDYARLDVYEHAVEIRPALLPHSPTTVRQGKQAHYTARSVDVPQPLTADSLAWIRGVLVADRMRLEEFINELSRYRPGYMRCARQVADLAVSGSFPLADTDRVLDMLALTLPVRIHRYSRYWVTVDEQTGRA